MEKSERGQQIDPFPVPVNPFLSPDDGRAYWLKFHEDFLDTPDRPGPIFKGSKDLIELIRDKRVGVGALIRITFAGHTHRFYMITSRGFIDYLNPKAPLKTFQEVLDDKGKSKDLQLESWYFEGHEVVLNEEELWTPEDSDF
jgi:hypothetical protein